MYVWLYIYIRKYTIPMDRVYIWDCPPSFWEQSWAMFQQKDAWQTSVHGDVCHGNSCPKQHKTRGCWGPVRNELWWRWHLSHLNAKGQQFAVKRMDKNGAINVQSMEILFGKMEISEATNCNHFWLLGFWSRRLLSLCNHFWLRGFWSRFLLRLGELTIKVLGHKFDQKCSGKHPRQVKILWVYLKHDVLYTLLKTDGWTLQKNDVLMFWWFSKLWSFPITTIRRDSYRRLCFPVFRWPP